MSAAPYTREEIESERAYLTRKTSSVFGKEIAGEIRWLATVDARDAEIARMREALLGAVGALREDHTASYCEDGCAGLALIAKIESAIGGDSTKETK